MDRNFCVKLQLLSMMLSLSARRAWIEIGNSSNMWCSAGVALRKESVDRNINNFISVHIVFVALRKESVDRNIMYLLTASGFFMSLSARRAWIEMSNV